MPDLSIDLSAMKLKIVIEQAEKEAYCDQVIKLQTNRGEVELLLKDSQYEAFIKALVLHGLDNKILSDRFMGNLSFKLSVIFQDRENESSNILMDLAEDELGGVLRDFSLDTEEKLVEEKRQERLDEISGVEPGCE